MVVTIFDLVLVAALFPAPLTIRNRWFKGLSTAGFVTMKKTKAGIKLLAHSIIRSHKVSFANASGL